ncbi:DUF3846 domain-containing protein [Gordonibacter sp. Marseille-P4307]|uniref:DUF3846 domain-containing protein n=1 Tax=Gordonibacter sp. Marseille-P4307 TaxID=2161815 RepID=UPI000F53C6A6|nr:DUF3846 domain-containing protein [Gordonibacter sp. Marseille-P4307]
MENTKNTLEVMMVPVGGKPYRKTLGADESGSFLRTLQECVGGMMEPAGYIFGNAPAVYVNEEELFGASLDTANRAVYATHEMAEAGYLSQMDYSSVVEGGDLYSIVFGDMVCVGFDHETGEDRGISDDEAARVIKRFGGSKSIQSGAVECLRLAFRKRAAV